MAEPTPTPAAKKKRISAEEVLSLFLKNLEAMHGYYRKQPNAGPERGIHSVHEETLAHHCIALEYAIEGKEWKSV